MTVRCAKDPIIIVGMHRSGTTMLVGLLKEAGVFFGKDLEENLESLFFLNTNREIFRRINAEWDSPLNMRYFLEEPDLLAMTAECLKRDVLSSKIRRYLGLKNYILYRSVERLDIPWGWKDPRTTFTLPIWLKLFPNAKIIYIVRNGIDVANSLMKRARKRFEERIRRCAAKNSGLKKAGYKGTARCLTLEGSFSLWEEYVEQGEKLLSTLKNPVITLKYEDFLSDPEKNLKELLRFCAVERDDVENIAKSVKSERKNAYTSDPSLVEFAERVKTSRWMRRWGYS